jgi:uncharacterized membrane protein YfcA
MFDKLVLKVLGDYRWLIFAMMIGSLLGAGIGIYAGKLEQQHLEKSNVTCVCPCTK